MLPLSHYIAATRQVPAELVRINPRHWLANDLIFAHSGVQAFVRGRPVSPLEGDALNSNNMGGTNHGGLLNARGWVPNGTNYVLFDMQENARFPMTLSAWWHGVASANTNPILSVRRAGTNVGGIMLARNSAENAQAVSTATSGNNSSAIAAGGYAASRWNHGVAVFPDASNRHIYSDGGNFATNSFLRAPPTDASIVAIGRYLESGAVAATVGTEIDGIALPLVIGRELTAEDVLRLYQEQRINPWSIFAEKRIWVPLFTSAATNTYTFSVSGGVAFSGTANQVHSKVFPASGGVTLSGSSALIKTDVFGVSGGVSYSGTAPITFTNGGTVFTITPSGGISFAGSPAMINTKVFETTGGVAFSGTNNVIKTHPYAVSGGVTFSGTAPVTFVPFGSATVTTYLPLTGVGN